MAVTATSQELPLCKCDMLICCCFLKTAELATDIHGANSVLPHSSKIHTEVLGKRQSVPRLFFSSLEDITTFRRKSGLERWLSGQSTNVLATGVKT